MRMPLLPSISARSGTSTKGARTINVLSDKNNQIAQKRPALVFSEGFGGLGNGLLDTPNGLFSVWDSSAVVDENGNVQFVGGGTLTALIVAGWTDLYITGMSDDGSVCSGYGTKTATAKITAVQLTATTLTELSPPSGITGATYGYSISGDGSTIVGAGVNASGVISACKWVNGTPSIITSSLTTWSEGGAYGVNDDGSVICGHLLISGVMSGFVSRSGSVEFLSLLAPHTSSVRLYAVSPEGQYVGGSARDAGTAQEEPLLYDAIAEIERYAFTGTSGAITGISQQGTFSCGMYNSGAGFRYPKGGTVTNITSGSSTIQPYAISKYGNAVIGEGITVAGTVFMFRWTTSGLQNLGRVSSTGTGTGAASGIALPKSGGCSGMGSTIAVTQFNGVSRTPAFRIPG